MASAKPLLADLQAIKYFNTTLMAIQDSYDLIKERQAADSSKLHSQIDDLSSEQSEFIAGTKEQMESDIQRLSGIVNASVTQLQRSINDTRQNASRSAIL